MMACSNKKPPPLRPICRQTKVKKPVLPSSINSYLPELVDFIDVVNLSTYLIAEGLLTYEERDIILSLKRKHLQVPELLQVLMTKGTNWYEKFRAALSRASLGIDVHLGHKELLEILPVKFEVPSDIEEHHHQQCSRPGPNKSVASPSYKSAQSSNPRHIPYGTSHSAHQMWFHRQSSGCLCGMPSSPTAMACDFRAQIASSCTNSSAAELVAYREKVLRGARNDEDVSQVNICSDVQSFCTSNNWSTAFSQQCSVLLTTVRDVESSLVDMSIERSNLQQENVMLKEENVKLKQEVEQLKKKAISSDVSTKQNEKDKAKKTTDASAQSAIKYFITQEVMHTAEADDIEKTKVLVRQSLNSFKFSYRREQHLKQFNLLVVTDLTGNVDMKISWCSTLVRALVGHALPSLQASLRNVGTYEKIFNECNVKFSLSLANLSDLSAMNMPFQPDIVLYCVDNVTSEHYQEAILELSRKHLGLNMWEHSIVLVHADLDCNDPDHIRCSDLRLFDKVIVEEGCGDCENARKSVPVFAIPESPFGIPPYVSNTFLAEFCLSSSQKTISPAQCALLGLNLNRLQPSMEVDYNSLPEVLHHQPIPLTRARGELLSECMSSVTNHAAVQQPLSPRHAMSDSSVKNMQVTFLRKLCHV